MRVARQVWSGVYNLILGLVTVFKHLGHKAITLQYPDERMPMFERSRGVVVLLSDPDTGKLNCTACLLCARACPVSAISIVQGTDPDTGKRYPEKFEIDNTICAFCGLCEEACNFDAIKLTGKYEFSVYDQKLLRYDRDFLQELGRGVPYEKRKKPTPKAKAAPKADPTSPKPEEPASPKPEAKPEESSKEPPGEDKPEA
jgi:NADH-quinone oxidoreductase subunit I